METTTARIGDNLPPPDLLTGDPLRQRLTDTHSALLRRRDELLSAAARVPAVTDDDIARRVSDFIKQLAACAKAADTARTGEKEPYLEGGRNIDGFFKSVSDPLADAKRRIETSLTVFLRQKEADERRRREEAERLAREEAAAKLRAAQAAEQALRDEQSLASAIAAQQAAKEAEADVIKAEQAADAKAADLSRTRGDFGAVSSLRTSWTFDGVDRAALDLEALRQHLPIAAIETAIRSYIKAGGRELKGTRIFETTSAVVR